MGLLDNILGIKSVRAAGELIRARAELDFLGAAVVVDDPLTGRTKITVGGVNSVTVASLFTRQGDYEGQPIVAKEYDAGHRYGGGLFYWVGASERAHDGGIVVGTVSTGRWIRVNETPIDVTWWGAKGNGVANDTPAFVAMRNYMLTLNPRPIHVQLSPLDYLWTTPRIWKGFNHLTIWQYGATFVNVGAWGPLAQGYKYGADTGACNFGDSIWGDTEDPLDGFGGKEFDPPAAGSINSQVYLLADAPGADAGIAAVAGAESVFTATPAHAGNFVAGDHVLIYGYDQQDTASFPPNPRYFEFRRVVSADDDTGEVTLDSELKHRYRTDWNDATAYTVTCGASRISKLTRANYQWGESLVVYGGEYKAYPGHDDQTNGTIYVSGFRRVAMYDVTAMGVVTSECESARYERCKFRPDWDAHKGDPEGNGDVETDKCVDSVVFVECELRNHEQGSGVNYLEFRNCKLTGSFQARGRNIVVDGCEVATISGTGANTVLMSLTGYCTHSLSVRNNRFFITSADFAGAIADGNTQAFTVPVDGVVDANIIKILRASTPAIKQFIEQGSEIWTSGNASPTKGVVLDFWEDATHTYIHVKDWTRPVVEGDVLSMYTCQQSYEHGNYFYGRPNRSTLYTGPYRVFTSRGGVNSGIRSDRTIDTNDAVLKREKTLIIKNAGAYNTNLQGFFRRITVDVQRAYTGLGTTCILRLQHGTTPSQTYGYIDCKVPGMREFSLGSHTTLAEDDALLTPVDISATAPVLCERTQFLLRIDGSSAPSADPADEAESPIIVVQVAATPRV